MEEANASSQGEPHPAAGAICHTLEVKFIGCHSGGPRPAQLDVDPGERLSDVIGRLCNEIGMEWYM